MIPKLEDTIIVDFVTSTPAGAAVDADSTPTCEVFEDANDTAILSPTVTKRTSKTGNYRISIACTAANGFETAKSYNVVVSATVGAIAAKAIVRTFQIRANVPDDIYSRIGAPAGASIAADLVVIDNFVDDLEGRLTSGRATNLDNLDAAISSRSSHSAADVWAAGTRTLTSFGSLIADIWAAVVDSAGVTTLLSRLSSGRAGNLDNLDATVSSRSSHSAADVWASVTRTLSAFAFSVTVGTNNDKTGYALTSGERTAIANEVEAQIIDETDSEKVLEAITDKIAAVNPDLGGLTVAAIASAVWGAVTRTLTAGTNIVLAKGVGVTGFNDLSAVQVNAEADTALADYDAPTNAEMVARTLPAASYALEATLTAIKGGSWSNETLKAIKDAVDLRLLTSGYTAPDNAGITAIKAKTDNLPASPANEATLTTIAAYIDTEVGAIKTNTDKVGTAMELDGAVYRFTTNALEMAPSGGGGGGATAEEIREEIDSNSTQLQVIRNKTDLITVGAITVSSPVTLTGNKIVAHRGVTLVIPFVGLGSLVGRDKLYFTVKKALSDVDSKALVQIEETLDLIRLNGAAGTANQGSLTVDDETLGNVTVRIQAAAAALLPIPHGDDLYYYDVKKIDSGDVEIPVEGRFDVLGDATRVVS